MVIIIMCNKTRLGEYVNVEDERMKCKENKYFTLYVVLCVWESERLTEDHRLGVKFITLYSVSEREWRRCSEDESDGLYAFYL